MNMKKSISAAVLLGLTIATLPAKPLELRTEGNGRDSET